MLNTIRVCCEVYQDKHGDFFGINVYHTTTFRIGTGIITNTFMMSLFGFGIIVPNHFWTHELVSWDTTVKFGYAFILH